MKVRMGEMGGGGGRRREGRLPKMPVLAFEQKT